ncbi:LysR substrate-binding domain-containing protein [Arvimicrobium flavum]|uniref:LysR substrate-binding domain-containing protein n=1 Tax=Arvimicrobium flavum TaxID=3393320 RepID=UPI00237BA51F|nr:LysR substrate-binding domain-containing protein [Mesorhizobium shangrilense]
MTLDQLRIFLEVATYEHVTRAAQTLNMTQSAVSAAVAALEARHGVTLFDRIGRRIELTQAGRAFVKEARSALRRAEEAERFLSDLGGTASGVLRLHASQTVASYWLPPHLVRFRERHPRVEIQLSLGNTRSATSAIMEGAADLAIVEGEVEGDGLLQKVVARDRLVLVVSKRHPWADGRPIGAADLSSTTWIMRESGSGTRAAFERDLAALGVDPSRLLTVLEMPSNEACLAAVEVGRSATVLSKRAALARLNDGSFHEVNFELPVRHFAMIRHAERHAARSVRAMMEMLETSAGDNAIG